MTTHKRFTYIMPHAPVEGTTPRRRRRSKLMFQEEREQTNEADAEQDLAEYKRRQSEKRGIKA